MRNHSRDIVDSTDIKSGHVFTIRTCSYDNGYYTGTHARWSFILILIVARRQRVAECVLASRSVNLSW